MLPEQTDTAKHHAALPYSAIPLFLKRLQRTSATAATQAALEFLILTASRTTEALHARWTEIDLQSATWVIPKERTKNKRRPHTVPLAPRTLAILKALKRDHSGESSFVLESRPAKPFSQMALLMLMRRMEANATVHGFRSSFRDWAAEKTNVPRPWRAATESD